MRIRLSCLAAAVVVLAVSCGGGQDPRDASGQGLVANPRQPIQVILRERGERLMAGDVEGYLRGLAPEARAFEEPIAQRVTALPLSKIDLTIGDAEITDDGSRFREASVHLRYNFKDLPEDNPFRVRLLYDIERQGESWVVTRSRFDRRLGVPPPPPLWPTGPVEISHTTHFLVMSRPGGTRVAEAAARAEQGFEQLLPRLTLEPDSRYLLVLGNDTNEYQTEAGEEAEGSVAFASFFLHGTAGHPPRPEERHVLADAEGIFRNREVNLEESRDPLPAQAVFQHELAHLALSRFTRGCTPLWVVEGGAMLLAGERRTGGWKERVDAGVLDDLRLNSEPVDYPFANAAVLHLVETNGAEKFFDFYQNFKNLPECLTMGEPSVRSALDERLLRRYYRLGVERGNRFAVEELEALTRDYIRKAVAA